MFIRKKKNRSGSTSVVVDDKSSGRFRELKTIGVSSDEKTISELCKVGREWISMQKGEQNMFAIYEQEQEEKQVTDYLLGNIENILLNGTQLILNRIFKLSKAGTIDYFKSYFDEEIEPNKIYRYLDLLYNTQQDKVQRISNE